MGGEIWVESEGVGKGTTVTFIVKLGLPEKPSEQDRQIAPSPASVHLRTDFSGVKVLVTDDNGYVFCIMVGSHFCRSHQCALICVPSIYWICQVALTVHSNKYAVCANTFGQDL